jgi:ribonuclease P protein component
MLPLEFRLKDKDVMSSILKSGIIIKNPFFNIRYKKISSPPQVLVMVSSKVSKKAVERNLIKRRIHEVFKKNVLKLNPELKMVIIVKKEILKASQNIIEREFTKAINIE